MTVWFGHKYNPSEPTEQLNIKIHSKVVTLENSVKIIAPRSFSYVFLYLAIHWAQLDYSPALKPYGNKKGCWDILSTCSLPTQKYFHSSLVSNQEVSFLQKQTYFWSSLYSTIFWYREPMIIDVCICRPKCSKLRFSVTLSLQLWGPETFHAWFLVLVKSL